MFRHRRDGVPVVVHRVVPHRSVDMHVDKSRRHIAAASVDNHIKIRAFVPGDLHLRHDPRDFFLIEQRIARNCTKFPVFPGHNEPAAKNRFHPGASQILRQPPRRNLIHNEERAAMKLEHRSRRLWRDVSSQCEDKCFRFAGPAG